MKIPQLTLNFRNQVLDVIALDQGEIRIGRDSDCDIQIDSLAIAPHQISLQVDENQISLTSIDPDFETRVDDQLVTNCAINAGSHIQLGKHVLVLSFMEPTKAIESSKKLNHPQHNPSLMGFLQIMRGSNLGKLIPLHKGMIQISSDEGDSAAVSHRDEGYFLSRVTHSSQIAIGQQEIEGQSYQLNDGDIISVGTSELQFFLQ